MARTPAKRSRTGKARKPAARARRDPARGRRLPARQAPTRARRGDKPSRDRQPLTIVGVGMSAGGLEAAIRVLEGLPARPGLAIVLIPHLAPHQHSSLPALLATHSKVPIVEAADAMPVEADRVYVLPPNVVMELADGGLRLTPRPTGPGQIHPVDSFFTSLAAMKADGAIGVILSGTGSDGSLGARTIKQRGGTVIVQQPDTAKYDGMPQSAIETGLVDLVLPPSDIGSKLVDLARFGYAPAIARPEPQISSAQFEQLTLVLRIASGVDFAHYKQATMRRRIMRRMAMHRFTDVGRYVEFVKDHPEEARGLYQDILIHVTRFFREPESFAALATVVLPKLMEGRGADNPVRIWVAGCATGEEAYSVAITVFEAADVSGVEPNLQLFGTDVSEAAVDFARQGVFPGSISDDVPADKLRRFFTQTDGGYRISKTIRDRCVFARQDLTRDPPFSRLDLIICRNVLIYMDAALQRRVMGVFHYALKPTAYLMLGQAETTGTQAEFFTLVEKSHRIYRKRAVERAALPTPSTYPVRRAGFSLPPISRGTGGKDLTGDARALQAEANRALLDRYGPAGVLVNDSMEILQFRGHTGLYLESPPGDASLNLLKLAREGLLHGLRSAVQAARKTRKPARKEALRVRSEAGWTDVNLEVIPLTGLNAPHFLVMFEPPQGAPPPRRPAPRAKVGPSEKDGRHSARLEEELASTREYLQSIIQEVEAANEELQSANEEILSSNEELQSTNEELDTAKEELQSTNEELNTLNEELHARNEELTHVNSDLVNLLGSVQIAIVIVSNDLRIRRFTPMAEKMLNLIPADVGRPITQVKPNIDVPDLGELIGRAVDKVEPVEREVKDGDGRGYSLRIRPYKGAENRIEGAVLALFDIDATRRHEIYTEQTRQVVHSLVETVAEPILILDASLRIGFVNRALCRAFGVESADAVGRFIYDLQADGSLSELRPLLETVVREKRAVDGAEVRRAGRRTMQVSARPIDTSEFGDGDILVAFHFESGQAA